MVTIAIPQDFVLADQKTVAEFKLELMERDRTIRELRERIADLETHLTLAMTEKHDAETEAEKLRQDLDDALHDHSVTLTHLSDPPEFDVLGRH